MASAGTFTADCSSGATCNATIEGTGSLVIEESSGLKLTCTSTTGSISQTSGASTGTASIAFKGCTESIFGTSCNSTGAAAGEIKTNAMTTDLIYIDPNKTTPGVLYTGVNMTYSCAGGTVRKTVTGNFIDHIENPECGVARANHTTVWEAGATTGSQKYTQVTTTGTVFDLIVNNDAGGAYATTSWTGTCHVNYTEGKTLKLTC
jgi:hypothetical protein